MIFVIQFFYHRLTPEALRYIQNKTVQIQNKIIISTDMLCIKLYQYCMYIDQINKSLILFLLVTIQNASIRLNILK